MLHADTNADPVLARIHVTGGMLVSVLDLSCSPSSNPNMAIIMKSDCSRVYHHGAQHGVSFVLSSQARRRTFLLSTTSSADVSNRQSSLEETVVGTLMC